MSMFTESLNGGDSPLRVVPVNSLLDDMDQFDGPTDLFAFSGDLHMPDDRQIKLEPMCFDQFPIPPEVKIEDGPSFVPPSHLNYVNDSDSTGNSSPMSNGSGQVDQEAYYPPSPDALADGNFMDGMGAPTPFSHTPSTLEESFDVDGYDLDLVDDDLTFTSCSIKMEPGAENEDGDCMALNEGPPHKKSKSGRGSGAAKAKGSGRGRGAGSKQVRNTGPAPAPQPTSRHTSPGASDSADEHPSDDEFDIEPFDETGMTKDEIKKKRRMLKNRQSASLSRKRKKEYLDGLEAKCEDLAAENNKLRARLAAGGGGGGGMTTGGGTAAQKALLALRKENATFKTQIKELQRENAMLRGSQPLGGSTGAGNNRFGGMPMRMGGTALMAVMVCFALFQNPLAEPGGVALSATNQESYTVESDTLAFSAALPAGRKYGRTLKSVEISSPMESAALSRRKPKTLAKHRETSLPLHSPSTEVTTEVIEMPEPNSKPKQAPPPQTSLESWLAANEARVVSQLNLTLSPLKKPSTALSTDIAVARAIEASASDSDPFMLPPAFRFEGGFPRSVVSTLDRRDDTSYLFCSEVHIVGAVSVPEGSKPKLAIVMPADKVPDHVLQTNGNSTIEDVTPVLQVDCDVINTQVVQTVRSGGSLNTKTVGRDSVDTREVHV